MNNSVRSILFLASLSIYTESVAAAVVYTENFESGTVGTEWTTNSGSLIVDTAPGGQKILGADDGLAEGLSNQSVTLALTGLAAHSKATVSPLTRWMTTSRSRWRWMVQRYLDRLLLLTVLVALLKAVMPP